MLNNTRGPVMSALLLAATLAATASALATGCVAYILISFSRSGALLASRTSQRSYALMLAAPVNASRRRRQQTSAAAGRELRPAWAD